MKRLAYIFLLFLVVFPSCREAGKPQAFNEPVSIHYDSLLRPFYHGVASGDPLSDRVILWTRVTPDVKVSTIPVKWEIAEEASFSTILQSDTLSTTPAKDYTVKVDAGGLKAGSTYYYRFNALGKNSVVGRTKTLPGTSDSLKFAVVSCSNWEFGYFNAYDRIAEKEVDAVLHLGDYIYEYGKGRYGDTTIGRFNLPAHEIISLEDYRTRHSLYRLDQGLRNLGGRHPMIAIWDDHEIANNSYMTGAQNHQPENEGEYEKRKAVARQAYYEWIPIREGEKHYRSFSFGPLADLVMLDERLEGRTQQLDSITDPRYNSDENSMLGKEQLQWLEGNLKQSKAVWKIIGNQVIFSDMELKAVYPNMPKNLDSWDGYPAEKEKIKNIIIQNKLSDIVFLAGDTHASWAIEVTENAKVYNPKTSSGTLAVEFGTTSVSSGNGDDGRSKKTKDEVMQSEEKLMKANLHVKYLNNRDHGYMMLTLFPESARAEWFYVNTLRKIDNGETLAKKFEVKRGRARLTD